MFILFSVRMAPFDGSAWEEEEEDLAPPPDVPYYNNFPGKQPPPGGLLDMRIRQGHSTGSTLVRHPMNPHVLACGLRANHILMQCPSVPL